MDGAIYNLLGIPKILTMEIVVCNEKKLPLENLKL
jgi:hypothetical protein